MLQGIPLPLTPTNPAVTPDPGVNVALNESLNGVAVKFTGLLEEHMELLPVDIVSLLQLGSEAEQATLDLPEGGNTLPLKFADQPLNGGALPVVEEGLPVVPQALPLVPQALPSPSPVVLEVQPRQQPVVIDPGLTGGARFIKTQEVRVAAGSEVVGNAVEVSEPRLELPGTAKPQLSSQGVRIFNEVFHESVRTPAVQQEIPQALTTMGLDTGPSLEVRNTRTAGVSIQVAEPMGNPQWGNAVSQRVVWMAGQNIQQAHIHLNPPELGPMEVRVVVRNEEASVLFSAQHQVVKEALEAALPRLREMFGEQGLNLASVDVGTQGFGREQGTHQAPAEHAGLSWNAGQEQEDRLGTFTGTEAVAGGSGLVNLYA